MAFKGLYEIRFDVCAKMPSVGTAALWQVHSGELHCNLPETSSPGKKKKAPLRGDFARWDRISKYSNSGH